MARPSPHRRRSRRWALPRLGPINRKRALSLAAISLVSIAIAWAAALSALANAARAQNPGLVGRLVDDPIAPLLSLQNELSASPARILRPDAQTLIRESLRRQALNTPAIRLLAVRAEALGDTRGAIAFARLSERTSRRDLVTQLLLIEQAVRADNPDLALVHYDKALKTSGEARSILFPILNTAIASDVIRRAFVPYVRRQVYWMPDFVQFSVRTGENGPRDTARLLILAGAGSQPDLMRINGPTLIAALVDHGEVGLAQQLFLQMPGTNPGMLQDTGFTATTTNLAYGLFAWTAATSGSAGASFDGAPDSARRSAHLFASAGERSILLRRVVGLPPGRYYHNERRSLVAGDGSSRAYWEMKCFNNGQLQSIWRGPDRAAYSVSRAPGPVVPAGCSNQLLELNVVAGDGSQGLDLAIEDFRLIR